MKDYNKQMMEKITQTTCDYYEVDVNSVRSKSRKKEYIKCKHIICAMIYDLTDSIQSEISEYIGYKERSTVCYIAGRVNERRKRSAGYRYDYDSIEKIILSEMKNDKTDNDLLSLRKEYGILYNKLHKITFNPESKYYLNSDLTDLENKSKQFLKDLGTFTKNIYS